MTMLNAIAAELRKLVLLPSALVATVLGTGLTLVLTATSMASRRTKLDGGMPEDGLTLNLILEMPAIGVIGVIVLGVVVIGSEYTPTTKDAGGGRQIAVSLTATPNRGVLLAAKAIVLALVSGVLASVTVGAGILISLALLGSHAGSPGEVLAALGWRPAGAVAYWVLTALIAFAVTVMTRNGVVPMVVFIVNTSVVSVSFLLSRVTSLAKYLPDVAGAQMFARNYPVEVRSEPLVGGLIMAAWAAVLLAVAAGVFIRRDA
ncbi:ABC transporter permease [Nonomuraea sp. NPDC046802]|uniref:ABC transporter permease n=1 Tax=Nonomuraea sp. NPDC046802 TaxID=3154919 RepID=UPI003405C546